jgi:hypothetical protein
MWGSTGVQSVVGRENIITEQQGLAMKADLALPWNKMRELRRYNYMRACTLSSLQLDKVAEGIWCRNGRREEATVSCPGVGGR